jgi:hypothetical protein
LEAVLQIRYQEFLVALEERKRPERDWNSVLRCLRNSKLAIASGMKDNG